MRKIAGAALLVTLFVFISQAVAFVTQMAMATLFGAGVGMDAFLAASAVPQYIIAVILGSLGVVFIPVFTDYIASGREAAAWEAASIVINLTVVGLGGLVIVGIFFPQTVLALTAPGLTVNVRALAVQLALILWPSVLATGIISLLTGIYQAQSRFGWPAAVPMIGAVVNLGLMLILAKQFGIIGLAIATTFGLVLQAGLLLPLLLKHGHYQLSLNWRHPGAIHVFRLLVPLILVNAVAKSTPLIERFFASKMPEGSISHLGYAFRIFSVLSLLISTGIATVIFPRMATDAAGADMSSLRQTLSTGMRVMWLAIAPALTIGLILAFPLVLVVFRRGQFDMNDAAAVSRLIQIYLLALPSACLGNVTGRGFYALKDTRTIAVLGSIESVAYVIYTLILAKTIGTPGIALSYVILFNISLTWQLLIVRRKTGSTGGWDLLNSFMRTGLAALFGGAMSWGTIQYISSTWLQLIFGGLVGLLVYGIALWFIQSREINQVWNSIRAGRS